MGARDLARAGVARDEQLASLFRRWPALSPVELRTLAQLYGERVRIAKYLGKLRTPS